jgi:nifR3 family TIM-barrel protein
MVKTRGKKTVIKASKNFWETLPKPFFVLAPMANVTDFAFRQMITKYGKPDVMWTEFVSADGLMSSGREKLLHNLKFTKKERPIVAQLFTGHPEAMRGAAALVAHLGFDGLDLNMGCPDRAVEKQGGGASMMKDTKKALAILEAARQGVGEIKKLIPVSVKTRIGYNKVDLSWIKMLLEQNLPAMTVHLRTRKEMSDVPAHWDVMPEIVKMRDEIAPETLIIGNGDIDSMSSAIEATNKYGCDGVMVGRGIFGKPWFFSDKMNEKAEVNDKGTISKRLNILVEHTKLFEKSFKNLKNFDVMKKHFKAYASGFDGAKELRVKLMETTNARELAATVKEYLSTLNG